MGRKYFGTDGIRGRANDGVLDAATAMKVGQAAGRHFLRGTHKHRIIIGKDTRLSGYMMETAMVAGFSARTVSDGRSLRREASRGSSEKGRSRARAM